MVTILYSKVTVSDQTWCITWTLYDTMCFYLPSTVYSYWALMILLTIFHIAIATQLTDIALGCHCLWCWLYSNTILAKVYIVSKALTGLYYLFYLLLTVLLIIRDNSELYFTILDSQCIALTGLSFHWSSSCS